MGVLSYSPVKTISGFLFHGESFVSVIDLLKWIDSRLTEGEPTPVTKSAYAWLQYSFDQLRNGPQADIRSWQRNGIVFASATDLISWLDTHPNTLEGDEKLAVIEVRKMLVKAKSKPATLDDDSNNAPYQMFKDYIDVAVIKLCCRWALMVQWDEAAHERFSAENPVWITYLFDKRIRIQVKTKDMLRAIRAAVGMIAATPTAPHHAAAVICTQKNMVLNASAFDAIDPMAGFDENAVGSAMTDAQVLAAATKPSQSRNFMMAIASGLRLAKLSPLRRIDSFTRWFRHDN